jgi:hypothetical protein
VPAFTVGSDIPVVRTALATISSARYTASPTTRGARHCSSVETTNDRAEPTALGSAASVSERQAHNLPTEAVPAGHRALMPAAISRPA